MANSSLSKCVLQINHEKGHSIACPLDTYVVADSVVEFAEAFNSLQTDSIVSIKKIEIFDLL